MNPRVILVLNLFLFACNAYRTSPESVILFTKQDLSKRGFVISPLVDLSPGNTTSVSEENAFDTILSNTLSEEWKNVKLLPTVAVIQMLDGEQLELWRDALKKEDAAQSSPSTLKILKKLDALGKSHPSQVLLPSILQNSLSCGRKEALSTYLNPDVAGAGGVVAIKATAVSRPNVAAATIAGSVRNSANAYINAPRSQTPSARPRAP